MNLPVIRHKILVNDVRRPDLVCRRFTSVSDSGGNCELWAPNAHYDSQLLMENDRVEIVVDPIGVVFRGYVTSRNTNIVGEVTYTALDYMTKFQDTFFNINYNFLDEVTNTIKSVATVRQIAHQAYLLYENWRGTDYQIFIDLSSFPDVNPGVQILVGLPLLEALQQALASVDYRYKIFMRHETSGSYLTAFKMGTGATKNIIRATDLTKPQSQQPIGPANALDITKNVNASQTVSQIYAHGDNRLIETSFPISGVWDSSINEDAVLTYYERFANQTHQFNGNAIPNPNYKPEYVNVGTKYQIPTVDDVFTPSGHFYFTGEPSRQVAILQEMVQSNPSPVPSGQEALPMSYFAVVHASGQPYYQIIDSGFSVEDNMKYVTFDEPLRYENTHILYREYAGGVTWDDLRDEGGNTTQIFSKTLEAYAASGVYERYLDETSFNDILVSGQTYYFVPGSNLYPYPIKEWDDTSLTIYGNFTLDLASPVTDFVNYTGTLIDFIVTDRSNVVHSFGACTGYKEAIACSDGDDMITGFHAGDYVFISVMEGNVFPTSKPSEINVYKVIGNTAHTLFLDGNTDATGVTGEAILLNESFSTYHKYDEVWLNASYRSHQRLSYETPDIGTIRSKRIISKEDNSFLWQTQRNNWQWFISDGTALPSGATPSDYDSQTYPSGVVLPSGALVALFNEGEIDTRCDVSGLQQWALNEIQGINQVEVSYTAKMPIQYGFRVGDRIKDNNVDVNASITEIEHDLDGYTTRLSAVSRG